MGQQNQAKNNQQQNQSKGKDDKQMQQQNNVVNLTETQEMMKEVKEIVVKGSNEYDVQIVEKIVNGIVERTKLEQATEMERIKLEHAAQTLFKQHEKDMEETRQQQMTKRQIWTNVATATMTSVSVSAIAAMSIVGTLSNNNLKRTSIEQGLTLE